MKVVAIAVLAGCWHAPAQPPRHGPEVVVRRHSGVNAELVGCAFGDGTVMTGPKTMRATWRHRWTEHTREVSAEGAITLTLEHVVASMTLSPTGDEPHVSRAEVEQGKPFEVDARNRTPVAEPPAPPETSEPPTRFAFDPMPQVEELLDVAYPEGAIAAGDTFELHLHKVKREEATAPVDRWLDVTFTVERVVPRDTMHLSCAGSERQAFRAPAGQGESHATVACSVDLDLRDGRSARWRIDTAVSGKLEGKAITGSMALAIKMHHDITLAQAGREDASVCSRATE